MVRYKFGRVFFQFLSVCTSIPKYPAISLFVIFISKISSKIIENSFNL